MPRKFGKGGNSCNTEHLYLTPGYGGRGRLENATPQPPACDERDLTRQPLNFLRHGLRSTSQKDQLTSFHQRVPRRDKASLTFLSCPLVSKLGISKRG